MGYVVKIVNLNFLFLENVLDKANKTTCNIINYNYFSVCSVINSQRIPNLSIRETKQEL